MNPYNTNPYNTATTNPIPLSLYDQVKTPPAPTPTPQEQFQNDPTLHANLITKTIQTAKSLYQQTAIPEIVHGVQTGDWKPYVTKVTSGPSVQDIAKGTPEGKDALMNYVMGFVNPEGGALNAGEGGIEKALTPHEIQLSESIKNSNATNLRIVEKPGLSTTGKPTSQTVFHLEADMPGGGTGAMEFQTRAEAQRVLDAATKNPTEGQLPASEARPSSEPTSSGPEKQSTQALAQSLEDLNQTPERAAAPLQYTTPKDFRYVKNEPVNVAPRGTDKATATSLRSDYAGLKNAQIVRGNQLADEIRAMAPKEQEGMFWYKAANGDAATLEGLLKKQEFEPYYKGIQAALNLSDSAKAALAKGEQYYKEAGATAKQIGTIGNIRENYQNRIYKPEPEKDFVKTEMGQGLKQNTGHAKARVFDTEMQAVEAGKKFATTNYADALAIHNEEMARVNAARTLMDNMQHGGIGAWTDHVPSGWQQVGQLRKGQQIFAAPNGIADGLKAIADPDFMKKVDSIRFLQKYQGLAKSVDLAFSFFHHLTFITQTLSSKKGLSTLVDMVNGGLKMDSPEFKAMEIDFVRNGGMTSHVAATQDIMRELAKGDDNISKLLQLPVGRQIDAIIQASNRFLFEKMQRFLKVMTYQKNMANWIAKNPEATNAEVQTAKAGFTKATNAEFGGLNWQAMGITKSNQSILRTIFLAPDWLTSAGAQAKYALSDTGTAGQQARYTLVKAIVGGMVITEGINKLLTGHFTDQNPKGHHMEIEVAPNVYTSLVRGAPGELVKFISNVTESGAQGAFRYMEGKLAPVSRTGLGLVSGVDYYGKSIWQGGKHPNPISKTFGGLMFVLQNASPVPFGATALGNELLSGKATPAGVATTATGLGRFSLPPKKNATGNPYNQ